MMMLLCASRLCNHIWITEMQISHLKGIYSADAAHRKWTPERWSREQNSPRMLNSSFYEQMETTRSLPYFIFPGSLVFSETAFSSTFSFLVVAFHPFCYTENRCVKACWHSVLRSRDTCSTLGSIEYESWFSLVSCRPIRV